MPLIYNFAKTCDIDLLHTVAKGYEKVKEH